MDNIWKNWKVVAVPSGTGGAEARHRNLLVNKHRQQITVLKMINETYPQLVRGELNVQVPDDVVRQWESEIFASRSGSATEIRNKINFLALGLLQGKRELGWDVLIPAPQRVVRSAASPFTPQSFHGLSYHRDWQKAIESSIRHPNFQQLLNNGNTSKGHRRLDPEYISWGLFLYVAITRDGVINSKHLYGLALSTGTLSGRHSSAWLVLHDTGADQLKGKKPPLTRWLLGVQSLSILMRHLHHFGSPVRDEISADQLEKFTQAAWRQFCRALGVEKVSLTECMRHTATALRLHTPEYLVRSALGKHSGTSISETRWRQLLMGGYLEQSGQNVSEGSDDQYSEEGRYAEILSQQDRSDSLDEAHQLLKSLRDKLYKNRGTKRLIFRELTEQLELAVEKSCKMAPIVECLCRWLLFLHIKKKRKQSTLYKYLSTNLSLLQSLGNTPVDQERLPHLVEAYQYVVEQAKTEKNRCYRWAILSSFHSFLVAELGLPHVSMEFDGQAAQVERHADANCISEDEYRVVAHHLSQGSGSALGAIQYWVFVLGYRAGLRIGEALSIQVHDVLISQDVQDTEVILLIRNNVYFDTKSHDSRRQLPLHLLLTDSELEAFKSFYCSRNALAAHGRVMLFGLGGHSVAPLQDGIVQSDIHSAMRQLIGDPSLRYQHLRHSLANYLLLSFHGIDIPWSAPSHLGKLWGAVRDEPSRSGLYFIAQIMGHSSPDVTLRSYLHFTDLLLNHFCHQRSKITAGAGIDHPIAQLEVLNGIVDIKPATLRQWKRRFGEKPPLWLARAYPLCEWSDISEHPVTPYPSIPTDSVLARPGLQQLSLEQIETILQYLNKRSVDEVVRIFNLLEHEAGLLKSCAKKVLSARTGRGNRAYRHVRKTAGKHQPPDGNGPPRLSVPHSLRDRQVTVSLYQAVWASLSQDPDVLRRQLRYFYRFHRATDGHVWVRDIEDGLSFVAWVLSLDARVRAVIKVTPSAHSSLTEQEQEKAWQNLLSSQSHKVSWELKEAGRRYRQSLGTGVIEFYIDSQSRKSRSGYPVRYTLVMACIIMAAFASGH
ncbi:DNA breaking-rejoining enzyme, catalytic core [Nitrincola sp.]|uniref:DNA breaking-rejoining enzyme, catalytic core n=1 Tax=Nitrincola sp. TaxID=1926584 RepID=UPI003A8DDB99